VGDWVTNPQRGKGFATASVRAIVGQAAAVGTADLFAGVDPGNAVSRRVLEKCGFVEAADLHSCTRFHDRTNPLG
jgi:RimJ/RimL family protein N-acetyltransferase